MTNLIRSKTYFGLVIASLLLGFAHEASAFCGFFVTGADAQLYANATMVVLMRDGTRTVLSMQNNYQGPPDQFALVIPVPVVLQQAQVKTLSNDVFARVDQLGAPRLVEYWEQDPCRSLLDYRGYPTAAGGSQNDAGASPDAASGSVRVEAQFAVGEYDVVILSADDSSSLSTWLTENKYNIPPGAAPVLAPYVAAGMKFFVAKVDTSRVTFQGNQAALSPLRFYYDSNEFSLPVRLGLLNSHGAQDLIVNILAPNQRFEVANYANATIPTNIRVRNEVRDAFGSFYEGLFQRAIAGHPRTVVTEYSWDAQTCDPCPIPPLTANELATLGADVTRGATADGGAFSSANANLGYTLTRLHYRYAPSDLGEDLVFSAAPTLQGGRGVPDQLGNLNSQITTGVGANNFQGRYVILHPWTDALTCERPQRGSWGGPPSGSPPPSVAAPNVALRGTQLTAARVESLVAQDVTSLNLKASRPVDPLVGQTNEPDASVIAEEDAGDDVDGIDATDSDTTHDAIADTSRGGGDAGSREPVETPVEKPGCSCRLGRARATAGDASPVPLAIGAGALLALSFLTRRRRGSRLPVGGRRL